MQRPKAHHFVPVSHLAMFGAGPPSGRSRDSRIWLFDKRTDSYREARVEKTAFENDLYTIRIPQPRGNERSMADLVATLRDPANKDAEVEALKAEIEDKGVAALREVVGWPVGLRELSEDDRAPVLSYMGLLLQQHPTMMAARAAAIEQRFAAAVAATGWEPDAFREFGQQFATSEGVLTLLRDAFATAYELNHLAWKVVRWPKTPQLVLGDNAVVAFFGRERHFTVGDPFLSDATFTLPINPSTALMLTGLVPGACVVEDRTYADGEAEVAAMNWVSWTRARSEVYAPSRDALERVAARLPAAVRSLEFSLQMPVREEGLVQFRTRKGRPFSLIRPNVDGAVEARRRFEAARTSQPADTH